MLTPPKPATAKQRNSLLLSTGGEFKKNQIMLTEEIKPDYNLCILFCGVLDQ